MMPPIFPAPRKATRLPASSFFARSFCHSCSSEESNMEFMRPSAKSRFFDLQDDRFADHPDGARNDKTKSNYCELMLDGRSAVMLHPVPCGGDDLIE